MEKGLLSKKSEFGKHEIQLSKKRVFNYEYRVFGTAPAMDRAADTPAALIEADVTQQGSCS